MGVGRWERFIIRRLGGTIVPEIGFDEYTNSITAKINSLNIIYCCQINTATHLGARGWYLLENCLCEMISGDFAVAFSGKHIFNVQVLK